MPLPNLYCSPLGAVPKKDGTYRIILDLSSPRGIPQDIFSVKYSSFDDAVSMVGGLGQGAFMGKLDIRHAFRLCPVHISDWPLSGFYWEKQYFVDTRLPFGSRSSPYIFNEFAELSLWILVYVSGVSRLLHYLDDFFVCAKSFEECNESMAVIQLGVSLTPEKIIGPSSSLTYLGIEIDSVAQVIRLPDEKLSNLKEVLEAWLSRDSCSKRQLLSLIGSLSFASKVVKPGRMFLRRLINLSTKVSQLHQVVHLDLEAKADIQWWAQFLSSLNGVEYFQAVTVTSHSLKLYTDASSFGFAAVYGSHWFSSPWSSQLIHQHINFLELFAIVSAVLTWSHEWFNQQVIIYTQLLHR